MRGKSEGDVEIVVMEVELEKRKAGVSSGGNKEVKIRRK